MTIPLHKQILWLHLSLCRKGPNLHNKAGLHKTSCLRDPCWTQNRGTRLRKHSKRYLMLVLWVVLYKQTATMSVAMIVYKPGNGWPIRQTSQDSANTDSRPVAASSGHSRCSSVQGNLSIWNTCHQNKYEKIHFQTDSSHKQCFLTSLYHE